MSRTRELYQTPSGRAPFADWLHDLADVAGRAKIRVRLDRLAQGNRGDHRFVAGGLVELWIDFGPGYRVYVGLRGTDAAVILCGGDKSPQDEDIRQAVYFWKDYKARS